MRSFSHVSGGRKCQMVSLCNTKMLTWSYSLWRFQGRIHFLASSSFQDYIFSFLGSWTLPPSSKPAGYHLQISVFPSPYRLLSCRPCDDGGLSRMIYFKILKLLIPIKCFFFSIKATYSQVPGIQLQLPLGAIIQPNRT